MKLTMFLCLSFLIIPYFPVSLMVFQDNLLTVIISFHIYTGYTLILCYDFVWMYSSWFYVFYMDSEIKFVNQSINQSMLMHRTIFWSLRLLLGIFSHSLTSPLTETTKTHCQIFIAISSKIWENWSCSPEHVLSVVRPMHTFRFSSA